MMWQFFFLSNSWWLCAIHWYALWASSSVIPMHEYSTKDILHVMLAHRDWNHLLGLKWITGNRSTFTRNVESQKANLHFSTLPSVAYLIWDVLSYTFIILAHINCFHPTNWMLFKMWSLFRCVSLTLFKYILLFPCMYQNSGSINNHFA